MMMNAFLTHARTTSLIIYVPKKNSTSQRIWGQLYAYRLS